MRPSNSATASPSCIAADFSDTRYRIWSLSPGHAVFSGGGLGPYRFQAVPELSSPEVQVFEVQLRDDNLEAAMLLAALQSEGVRVSRFEKVPVSLAALIEAIVGVREPSHA